MSSGVEKAILANLNKEQSPLIQRVTLNNQIILHNYVATVSRSYECKLLGCCQKFDLELVPNQVLYPKYCEDHRNSFRRENFLHRFAMQTQNQSIEALSSFSQSNTSELE